MNVTITQLGHTWTLSPGANDVELTEAPALIAVTTESVASVFLDDEVLSTVSSSVDRRMIVGQIDLKNQIGIHRLRVNTETAQGIFDFTTMSAKATWAEIQMMADVCARHYLGYRRQFVYTSRMGEVRRVFLPQIQFAWFRDRIDEIESIALDIARRPSRETNERLVNSVRGRGVSVPATIKLIHENPAFLEQRTDGPVEVNGTRYWPSEIRARVRDRVPAALEHTQIGVFLRTLLIGAADLATQLEDVEQVALKGWQTRLSNLAAQPIFRLATGLRRIPTITAMPSVVQRTDRRYKRIRDLSFEFQSDIAPRDTYRNAIRSNIKDAWDIYQTFVAHVVGNSLSLEYVSATKDLRTRNAMGASMTALDGHLFFDIKPPRSVALSWRETSSRPANERPDVLIHRSNDGALLMLDAKFRVGKSRRQAKSEDLFEMQGYLNSFAMQKAGILFPGVEARATYTSGGGNKIAEIPLRAQFFKSLGGADEVHAYIRESVGPLWVTSSDQ